MENWDLNAHIIEKFLKKPCAEFTKKDLIYYIEANGIEMVNFRYQAEDGRLKTLNFTVQSRQHLETIFSSGERVDGSSLFSFIEAGSSDLYVVPRFRTAFVNPFSEIPAIDILCSFYDSNGKPLESAPEFVLRKAHQEFKKTTGLSMKALGELEFYIIADAIPEYPATDQRGYHGSSPFIKYNEFRIHAMKLISECGGHIKYGHSEVGNFSTGTQLYEQHEIEFLPTDIEIAAEQIILARWILRMLAYQYNITVSFAPKITVGKAGSGMHIHMLAEKDGKNVMIENNRLSDTARKMIAGLLEMASSLTAFGNTIPTSYLRLVPHQEAPTNICWGDRNRSVLVRVPLGWIGASDMVATANPIEPKENLDFTGKQTIELRSPDGTADVYFLLAGIVTACRHGFEMPDSLEKAQKLYVDVNIFKDENKTRCNGLEHLPVSCYDSSLVLEKQRHLYEEKGIFPAGTINNVIRKLQAYEDQGLSEKLFGNNEAIASLVEKFIHWK